MTPHTIFMLTRATASWLALTPKERFAEVDRLLRPVLAAHPDVKLRFFDSEWYSARVSDIMVWQTDSLDSYRSLVEDLRETPVWGVYFEIVEIIPAVENGFARHYGADALAS